MSAVTTWLKQRLRLRTNHASPAGSFRPRVEALEDRMLMSALTPAQRSANRAVQFLAREMDRYHKNFGVYEDVGSPGNHFHAWAKIPAADAPVSMNGSWAVDPRAGATAIQCEFDATVPFAGFYLQNGVLPGGATAPIPNFGEVPGAGIDLRGAAALTFWARGAEGGEVIEFFMGGVGRNAQTGQAETPFPDSARRSPGIGVSFQLTTSWRQFSINLKSLDLRYVLGGFAWVATSAANPTGAEFYLDDIAYQLTPAAKNARLNQPRLIRSFVTLPVQPDVTDPNQDDDLDFVLRNTAFTYDNALAIQAFLAHRTPGSLRRAELIGRALIYAMNHDRFFDDGRLRTAYAAGDLALPPGWTPNGRPATTAIPGFYLESSKTFFEVEQQATDTGNNAWGMMALLALHRRTGKALFLRSAQRLGGFIEGFRNNTGEFQGFQGGIENPEGASPTRREYASTEHNLDIHAAFSTMFAVTGRARWKDGARHALRFVEAMWDAAQNCYLTGTTDPSARNTDPLQLPLDVQAWYVLAVRGPRRGVGWCWPAPKPTTAPSPTVSAASTSTTTKTVFGSRAQRKWPSPTRWWDARARQKRCAGTCGVPNRMHRLATAWALSPPRTTASARGSVSSTSAACTWAPRRGWCLHSRSSTRSRISVRARFRCERARFRCTNPTRKRGIRVVPSLTRRVGAADRARTFSDCRSASASQPYPPAALETSAGRSRANRWSTARSPRRRRRPPFRWAAAYR